MKKTYCIKYFVTPTDKNVDKHKVLDSVVNCWILADKAIDAHLKAVFFIEKLNWKIIENRQEPIIVSRQQFENNNIKLKCFDIAQKEGFSFIFFGGNDPVEELIDQKTISLNTSYDFDANGVVKIIKNLKNKGRCLHFNSGEKCNKEIINAHSIQKKGLLSTIAHDGHVYVYDRNYWSLKKNEGMVSFKKNGINRVSTFMGFCKIHDHELFEPIDNYPMTPTEEQVFLYAYRSLCRELFIKENALVVANFILEKFKDNEGLFKFWSEYRIGTLSGLSSLEYHKNIYDESLLNKEFHKIRYILFKSSKKPAIVFSNLIYPDYDFLGRRLQNLGNLNAKFDMLTVCSVQTENGWGFLIAWHETSSKICDKYISSLITATYETNHIEDFLFRLALTGENIAISPKWWENISKNAQDQIIRWFSDYCDPMNVLENDYLTKGLHSLSNWKFDIINKNI